MFCVGQNAQGGGGQKQSFFGRSVLLKQKRFSRELFFCPAFGFFFSCVRDIYKKVIKIKSRQKKKGAKLRFTESFVCSEPKVVGVVGEHAEKRRRRRDVRVFFFFFFFLVVVVV